MTDPKTPHRRYLQFRLSTFLVVLTLVCLWFGWLVNRSNQRRKAVAWVWQMDGLVVYDSQYDDGVLFDAEPTGPKWVRDFYDQVVFVSLNKPQVHDLTPLANLKSLKWLNLENTPVHDLTPLANLKSLELLNLTNTPVSEEQITTLQQALPNCAIYYW